MREIVNFEISNNNVEISDFDKLRTQLQDNEHVRNIKTMIRYLKKCTDDYFKVGDKTCLCFCKDNTSRMDVDAKVGVNWLKIGTSKKEPNSNELFVYLHYRNENHNVTKRIRRNE